MFLARVFANANQHVTEVLEVIKHFFLLTPALSSKGGEGGMQVGN